MPALPVPPTVGVVLAVSALVTLYLGLLPGGVLAFAAQSASDLLP
jgi:hypothetical protein